MRSETKKDRDPPLSIVVCDDLGGPTVVIAGPFILLDSSSLIAGDDIVVMAIAAQARSSTIVEV